jgi:ATP-dependent Zn protease
MDVLDSFLNLQIHSRGIPLESDVDLQRIAAITDKFTGETLQTSTSHEAVCLHT